MNDSLEEIGQIASFIGDLTELRKKNLQMEDQNTGITYELLAFHKLASDKYRSLGLEYGAANVDPPTREHMVRLAEAAKRHGVEVWTR